MQDFHLSSYTQDMWDLALCWCYIFSQSTEISVTVLLIKEGELVSVYYNYPRSKDAIVSFMSQSRVTFPRCSI